MPFLPRWRLERAAAALQKTSGRAHYDDLVAASLGSTLEQVVRLALAEA